MKKKEKHYNVRKIKENESVKINEGVGEEKKKRKNGNNT